MDRLDELSISGMINQIIEDYKSDGTVDDLVSDLVADMQCAAREAVSQSEYFISDCVCNEIGDMNDQTYSEVNLLVKSITSKLTKSVMVMIVERLKGEIQ